ncbi:ABC transporter permease [Solwaraspora sp. WMMB335]|uniref:ABC transporter permease n=1 Tax=Solwaraspora sp. WMMB335 TaxID=3404118 RepID=UPI003B93D71B
MTTEAVDPSTSHIAVDARLPVARQHGFVRRALKLGRTRVGLAAVLAVVLFAIVGPFFAPYSTTEFVGIPFAGPSDEALFGTDRIGRDVWTRFLSGGRDLLVVSALATVLGVVVGTTIGLVAGYTKKVVDETLMRFVDLMMAFPGLAFSLLVITVAGAQTWVLVVAVGVGLFPHTARVVRSATVGVAESDYVRYSEATGTPTRRILFSEILPNILVPLSVETGQRYTLSLGSVAGLNYLGLGVKPPAADWGLMIQENQAGLLTTPMAVLLPVIAIIVVTVGANLVSDGLAVAAAGADGR